ncbi:MAG: hypothetical protein M5U19_03300 [Microthrixaceae bacterium]|nr:hypothetical protein [Microthrixaceae bacterium]
MGRTRGFAGSRVLSTARLISLQVIRRGRCRATSTMKRLVIHAHGHRGSKKNSM